MSKIDLRCGNWLDLSGSIQSKSVVVVTDPPYGINENGAKAKKRGGMTKFKGGVSRWVDPKDYGDFNWDKTRISADAISEIMRVSTQQVIFGGNYYTDYLPPTSSWVVWDKLNSGDFADCEMVWTSHKKAARMFRYMWNGMVKEKPEKRYHPTQKPLSLMEWIIQKYTNEGDTILDPYMGSGTTGVACVLHGRNFIGYDINESYIPIAQERVNDALASLGLMDKKLSENASVSPLFA